MPPYDELSPVDSRGCADSVEPAPLPQPPEIAAPQDTPYPGVIRLQVEGAEEIRQAVLAGQEGAPIELQVTSGKRHRTVAIDYRGGLRFPHLEPVDGAVRRLDHILKPRR